MKKYLSFMLFLLLCVSIFAKNENIITITHFSKLLNKEKSFNAYIPTDAKPNEQFPALYILHGAYGSYKDWTDKTNVAELAENYRMIIIFPDGAEFGWYVDSPVEKDSQYESYIIKELIPLTDKLFPTIASKEARCIMGLSMGGHGAFLLSAKHPDMFISASAMSGILKITNHPDKWQIAGRLGPLKDNKSIWENNSVYEQAEKFKEANVRLLFDCGEEDTATGAIGDSRELHQKFTELQIPHIWREMPGTHSWTYWQEHLEEHLNFHQAVLTDTSTTLEKWQGHYFKRLNNFFKENAELSISPPDKPTICLFGSSTMEGFPKNLLKDYYVFNRGITSDVLGIGKRGLSHRLEESVIDMKPNYVFINNGTNDLGNRHRTGSPSIERMVEEFDKIITYIKKRTPKTKIFIINCSPVRDNYAHLATPIYSYNMQLNNLAKKHEIGFIDGHKHFTDKDYILLPEFSKDGLHLNIKGYEILVKLMIEAINQK